MSKMKYFFPILSAMILCAQSAQSSKDSISNSGSRLETLSASFGNERGWINHCFAVDPPMPHAIWVDSSCKLGIEGATCKAKCENDYHRSEGSDGDFVCSKSHFWVPKGSFECVKDKPETWNIFGLSVDKVSLKHFDPEDWDLTTWLVFGGVFLFLMCSCFGCYRCCRSAWCCRSHFRIKRASEALNPQEDFQTLYDDYPEMWAPTPQPESSVNCSGTVFVRWINRLGCQEVYIL